MLRTLANCRPHPESVPINSWCGSRHAAGRQGVLDPLEFVRTIAVARITMPRSMVRLSAGREQMSEVAGVVFSRRREFDFLGPKLLTTPNPDRTRDMQLLDKLGLRPMI